MRIQQNIGMQDNSIQDLKSNDSTTSSTANSSSKSPKGQKNITAVSGANLNGESLIAQRQSLAKKQALKVVSDAFKGEKKLDAQMQSIKDEIKRLQEELYEKNANTRENNARIK